jgi:photosystem II stability/assembly factor-like uncharacterized protein
VAATIAPPSAHAAPTWTRSSPGGGGAFLCADVSADGTVLIGSDLSGLYRRWQNADWTRIGSQDGLTATSVEVVRWKPGSRQDALAGTRNGLYRTRDGGLTWSRVTIPVADMTVTALAWKGDVIVVAGAASSSAAEVLLMRSTDGGGSFVAVKHDLPARPERRAVKLAVDARDPNLVWLLSGHDRLKAGAKELWKSLDGGRSFVRMNAAGGKPYHAIDMVAEPRVGGVILMAVSDDPGPGRNDGRGAVYRSVDAGRTWEACSGLGGATGALGWGERNQAILVNVQLNACGKTSRAGRFESYDMGGTWKRVDDGSTWDLGWTECPAARGRAMRTVARTLSPDGSYWVTSQFVWQYAGSPRPKYQNAFSRQVEMSPATWITRGIDNAVPTAFTAVAAGPGRYLAGYYDLGLWKSTDGGDSWINRNPRFPDWNGFGGNVTGIVSAPNGLALATMAHSSKTDSDSGGVYLYSLWRSGDDGDTWTVCRTGLPYTGFLYGLSRDVATGRVWLTRDGQVFTSTDAGRSWRPAAGNLPRSGMYVVQSKDGVVLAGGNAGLYRLSGPDSTQWTAVEKGAFDFSADPGEIGPGLHKVRWHGIQQILFDPYTSSRVWVVSYYGYSGAPAKRIGIWRSDDRGVTFTQVSSARLRRGVAVDSLGLRLHVTSGAALTAGANNPDELNAAQGKETWRDDGSGAFRLRSIDIDHFDYRYPFGASVTAVEDGKIFVGVPGYGFMRQDLAPASADRSAAGSK